MITLISRVFSIEQCRINFDTLFVFGDNELREGIGGQAIIREQKNAIGLATKKSPLQFWDDKDFDHNKNIIDQDINNIKNYAQEYKFKAYCFPYQGLGTGKALLHIKAPKTFFYLCNRLLDEFNYNNVEALQTKKF